MFSSKGVSRDDPTINYLKLSQNNNLVSLVMLNIG